MEGDQDDPLQLDLQLCFPLYAASNLLTRCYRPVLTALGLTYPQYLVMLVLWEATPKAVGALGARLHLDTGTLTPLLKRMEAAGFLTRTRDIGDERRVLIDLTPQGRALRERALLVPQAIVADLDLPPQALVALRDSLKVMVKALSKLPDAVDPASPPSVCE